MGQLVEFALGLHVRSHHCLTTVLEHAGELSLADANREHEGFGYPSLRLQGHHVIGAERYWTSVMEGELDVSDDADDHPTMASLESLRSRVARRSASLIRSLGDDALQQPKTLHDWRGNEIVYAPLWVVMRTQTHLFHHLGQMAAMCRLLGRPIPGADFPLD
ncbi:MAG: DinB family protein [Planctomycetes bacterium]|nr:DinB family protein [Planctomycetota bacterium]